MPMGARTNDRVDRGGQEPHEQRYTDSDRPGIFRKGHFGGRRPVFRS